MEGRPPYDPDDELDFDFEEPRRRHWERLSDDTAERRRAARRSERSEQVEEGIGEEQPSEPYQTGSSEMGEPYEDPFDTAERRRRERERRHHRDLPAKVRRRQFFGAAALALIVLVGAFLLLRGGGGGDTEEPLAVKKLLGQSFVGQLPKSGPTPALLKKATKGQLGGVIVEGTEEVVSTGVTQMQDAAAQGGNPPLLVMVDQEGGPVKRLPGPPTTAPAELGAAGDAEAARATGEDTGSYLRGLGITVDLAPVLDVALPRTADTIAERTFGEDAALVADLGSNFIEGLQGQSVAATAKHFPGLGLATVNTDFAPVSVVGRQEELDAALEPFRAAISAGVQLVMVSSAAYPDYAGATPNKGKVKPASFAEPVVEGLLRDELGFEGVVITDDLESIAIKELTNRDVAAVAALAAGCDLVLYARTEQGLNAGFTAAIKAVKKGTLDRPLLEQSFERVTALKDALAAS